MEVEWATEMSKEEEERQPFQLTAVMKRPSFENDLTFVLGSGCLLYTSPSPRDRQKSRMPSSA